MPRMPDRRRFCPSSAICSIRRSGADSLVVNPHKWLFVPIDLSVLYVRDPELLRRTFSLVADYLVTPETDVHNYMDYGLQLGRRFRALKLWFAIRAYGVRGHAGASCAVTSRSRKSSPQWVAAEPGWDDRRAASALGRVLSFRTAGPTATPKPMRSTRRSWTTSMPTAGSSFRRRSCTAARCCVWRSATNARRATTSCWPAEVCARRRRRRRATNAGRIARSRVRCRDIARWKAGSGEFVRPFRCSGCTESRCQQNVRCGNEFAQRRHRRAADADAVS